MTPKQPIEKSPNESSASLQNGTEADKSTLSGTSTPESQSPRDLMQEVFDTILSGNPREHKELARQKLVELSNELLKPLSAKYFIAFLWTTGSINRFHLDSIFNSLRNQNLKDGRLPVKPVLLFIKSTGGSIEPAYMISKMCHELSKDRFIVCLPREAKSAATLIALGADEVHMGYLSELGPIDPQVNGLPALGLHDSLKSIARIVKEVPEARDLFALYLGNTLSLPYFGWSMRVPESAVQYGQKLLLLNRDKCFNVEDAEAIATKLVRDYKDHGFVIDSAEAKQIFSNKLIRQNSDEIKFCEVFYEKFALIALILRFNWKYQLNIVGDISSGAFVLSETND
ncbi:MAG: hypothetical protein E6R03_11215 [Hyphomicrobiaceae bacterium]|nr:MAG: hypothetical protein E6R03_11215 [Hyphomicrobiaceae bacterium]